MDSMSALLEMGDQAAGLSPESRARVLSIAKRCRSWAERFCEQHPQGKSKGDLTGACAIASGKLWESLREEGFDPIIAEHQGRKSTHFFILVSEHALDITATQFGWGKVVLLPQEEARRTEAYWEAHRFHKDPVALRATQVRENWHEGQLALKPGAHPALR